MKCRFCGLKIKPTEAHSCPHGADCIGGGGSFPALALKQMIAVGCLECRQERILERSPLSKAELANVLIAIKQRDAAELIIKAAREKCPGKNKTHALRKLLGLCPECGAETPEGRHYCDPCRLIMNARHRK